VLKNISSTIYENKNKKFHGFTCSFSAHNIFLILLCYALFYCTVSLNLLQVIFIWSVREQGMIASLSVSPIHSMTCNETFSAKVSADSQNSNDVDTGTTGASVEDVECADASLLPASFQPSHVLLSDAKTSSKYETSTLEGLNSPFIFHPAFYISDGSTVAEGIGDDTTENCNNSKYSRFLRQGRPNLPFIFQQVSDLCRESGLLRVGVVVCGPDSMTNEVKDLCRQSLMGSAPDCVRFDCHMDMFEL
jgi:hypothetical protein